MHLNCSAKSALTSTTLNCHSTKPKGITGSSAAVPLDLIRHQPLFRRVVFQERERSRVNCLHCSLAHRLAATLSGTPSRQIIRKWSQHHTPVVANGTWSRCVQLYSKHTSASADHAFNLPSAESFMLRHSHLVLPTPSISSSYS